jgi:hypothetical protein
MRHASFLTAGILIILVVVALAAALVCCSVQPLPSSLPPPPSEAAAPWVGCYQCDTTLRANHILGVDAGMLSIHLEDALSISASGTALQGSMSALEPYGACSSGGCFLVATVASDGRTATLGHAINGIGLCPVSTNGALFNIVYDGGTISLDAGRIFADLGVELTEVGGCGFVDAGLATVTTECTRLSDSDGCPW